MDFTEIKTDFTDKYINNSRIPKRYIGVEMITSEKDKEVYTQLKKIEDNIDDFVNKGYNLLIYGTPGNGKTQWAINIGLSYIKAKKDVGFTNIDSTPVLYTNITEYFTLKKMAMDDPTLKQNIIKLDKHMMSAKILIIDDLVKLTSDYEWNLLFNIINYRTSNGKTTIYTTNSEPKALFNELGAKLADRVVYDNCCVKHLTNHSNREQIKEY